jgi:predicted transcriptional regulator
VTREQLHALVDSLPTAAIDEAAQALREVAESEELSAEEIALLDEGLAEARSGQGRPAEDVLADLKL